MKKTFLWVAVVFMSVVFISSTGWSRDLQLAERFDSSLVVGEETSPVRIRMEEPEKKDSPSDLTPRDLLDTPLKEMPEEARSLVKDELGLDLEHFGGYGGPMIYYMNLDLSPLDPMTEDLHMDSFEEDMLLIGGFGGMIYKDFRLGGFGFGNSQDTSGRDDLGNRHSAELSYGGGGIFMEYNHTLSPNFGLAGGAMLGAGRMSLEASGTDAVNGDWDWDADESFFMGNPYLAFWVAPTKWMWIQLDAGYLFFEMDTSGSKFENDSINTVSGDPYEMVDDDLGGGFQAALKINFGYNPNL